MTLLELKDKKIKNVKIGAKGGSGFIYCGKPGLIDFDYLNDQMRERNQSALISASHRYSSIKQKKVSTSTYIAECEKKNAPISFEGYMKYLQQYFAQIKTAIDGVERANKRIADYEPLETREVVEKYKSITEPSTTIVLFDGTEQGSAWTTEEYQSGYVEIDNEEDNE